MDKREEQASTHTDVPYVVYRDLMAHNRWVVRALIVVLTIVVVFLVVSNTAWVYFWNQYDYSSEETVTTIDSKGDGVANYTGGDGGVIYGKGDGAQDNTDEN